MSRLPPLTIANSLSQNRPGFYRSASSESTADDTGSSPNGAARGMKSEVETPESRHISVHAHWSNVPSLAPSVASELGDDAAEVSPRGRPISAAEDSEGFGARREESPGSISTETFNDPRSHVSPYFPDRPNPQALRKEHPSIDSMRQRSLRQPASTESLRQRRPPPRRQMDSAVRNREARGLAPPRSPNPPRSPRSRRAPSLRSPSMDSEEESSASMGTSYLSRPRKLSSSSGLSTSPISPFLHPVARSPSACSEASVGGSRLPRPAFNFSRPISRASGVPTEPPSRQGSSDSQPYTFVDDTAHTPTSMYSEDLDAAAGVPGAPSYVYSRFALPRGKMLQRDSMILDDQSNAAFTGEQPTALSNNGQPASGLDIIPPSPPSRPATATYGAKTSFDSHASGTSGTKRLSADLNAPATDTKPQSRPIHTSASDNSHARSLAPSTTSSSTIKAKSQHSIAPTAETLSAEEHLAKGIECHERGSLNESSYHLRLAARQNHPTAMLLYALACRHGWGVRANQKEAVQWLRKAVDFASLEVADDEDPSKDGKAVDFLEKKTRKAQFALSIYELGVSHMNGWGIEQDKALALRCFEIAGGEYRQIMLSPWSLC
jgi:hypothetical protein